VGQLEGSSSRSLVFAFIQLSMLDVRRSMFISLLRFLCFLL
jgi:hypothetical protein